MSCSDVSSSNESSGRNNDRCLLIGSNRQSGAVYDACRSATDLISQPLRFIEIQHRVLGDFGYVLSNVGKRLLSQLLDIQQSADAFNQLVDFKRLLKKLVSSRIF